MWRTFPARRGWRGVVKWVLRGGRGADTDLEVRVRISSIVMEVVGLWGHSRASGWPERKARGDDRRPVTRQRGLLASLMYFGAVVFLLQGAGGALDNFFSRLDRDHGKGPDVSSRCCGGDLLLVWLGCCPTWRWGGKYLDGRDDHTSVYGCPFRETCLLNRSKRGWGVCPCGWLGVKTLFGCHSLPCGSSAAATMLRV